LQGARDVLQLSVLDVPHCNDFRFFRLFGLNVHRQLVLRYLFFQDVHHGLVYLNLNERDDRVSTKLLHVQDARVCQNLNERDDRVSTKHLHVLDDRVSTKHLHVLDDRVSKKQDVQDALI
jgi:hypothetical protein